MNRQIDWSSGNWPADESNWKDYVKELRLEITCGEAPFIVGRYNAANGKKKFLSLSDRVGFLDVSFKLSVRIVMIRKNGWNGLLLPFSVLMAMNGKAIIFYWPERTFYILSSTTGMTNSLTIS